VFVFGPVPSRRLGSSLGINHIPPKHCPYSCVYCQVGRTTSLTVKRRSFFQVKKITAEVNTRVEDCRRNDIPIDYLSLVPDGEPALDLNLGMLIRELKDFGIPVAVISNSSLLPSVDVQADLLLADWVSLKIDSVITEEWKAINRPHGSLDLQLILSAIMEFSKKYKGRLVTETMLVSGINDSKDSITALSAFLEELRPCRSYLSIPIRPPAEDEVKPPSATVLTEIVQTLRKRHDFIVPLFENEEDGFQSIGDLRNNILDITAVHPIRQSALRDMVFQSGNDWTIVEEMLREGTIEKIQYSDETFFRKNLK
jgi:wyosine [tRNA(Phe)-imidazoG37] synthetase (radical SAM superfamily)